MLKTRILFAFAMATLCAFLSLPAPAAGAAPGDEKKAVETPGASTAAEPGGKDPAGPPSPPDPAGKTQAAKPEGPVAVVNGTPIPRSDFERALQGYMQQFRSMPGAEKLEPNDTVKGEVIDQLVERELLYQEGKKFVTEDQKPAAQEELKNLQARFPSADVFREALQAQSLTEAVLAELIEKQITIRKYVEAHVAPGATVSEEEVKKAYEENKDKMLVPEQVEASHILIRVPEDAKPEDKEKARAKAQELRKKAAEGADFAQLAKESSEDPGSAPNGGELGYFTKDRMVEPFATAAFALKPGEVSEVVESTFGFHVIKATGRKEAGVQPLEEVREDLTRYLNAKALQEAIQKKVAELKMGARIEISALQK